MWLMLLSIYIILLVIVSLLSFSNTADNDTSIKLLRIYAIVTTITEIIAFLLYYKKGNNVIIYHIYSPIQLLILSAYYNQTIGFFKQKGIGYIIGVSGLFLSLFNSLFIQQPPSSLNSYFIIIEAMLVISMTLCYFYDFLNTKLTTKHFTTPDFWISCLLLLFWSFTFFRWLASLSMPGVVSANIYYILYMMWAINIITYTGFGLVFLFYRKLQPR